jgi:transcriptional regulator with XRE-family HTH domain
VNELKRVAELVAEERISRGWSQSDLAQRSTVGMSTIQRIEQAKPPMPDRRTLTRLALAFGKKYDAAMIRFLAEGELDSQAFSLSDLFKRLNASGKKLITIEELLDAGREAASHGDAARRAIERQKKQQ